MKVSKLSVFSLLVPAMMAVVPSAQAFIHIPVGAYVQAKAGQAYSGKTGVEDGTLYGVQGGLYLYDEDKKGGMTLWLVTTNQLDYAHEGATGDFRSTALYTGFEYSKGISPEDKLEAVGALGLSVARSKLSTTAGDNSKTRLSPYASVGLRYQMTEKLHGSLSYDYVNKDIQGAMLGLSWAWQD